jgi:hypothetical protein
MGFSDVCEESGSAFIHAHDFIMYYLPILHQRDVETDLNKEEGYMK